MPLLRSPRTSHWQDSADRDPLAGFPRDVELTAITLISVPLKVRRPLLALAKALVKTSEIRPAVEQQDLKRKRPKPR